MAEEQVAHDAAHVWHWRGPDQELIAVLETRHSWTADSELGPYYLAAVRRALS